MLSFLGTLRRKTYRIGRAGQTAKENKRKGGQMVKGSKKGGKTENKVGG